MLRRTANLHAPLRALTRSLSTSPSVLEKYINRVQLLGRVGNDPEERGDARPIVYFPLATSHTIKVMGDGDESFSGVPTSRTVTTWHAVIVGHPSFRKYVQEFVRKGCRVIVEGSLSYYKSTTKEGEQKLTASVKADDLIILSQPKDKGDGRAEYPAISEEEHLEQDFSEGGTR